MSWKDSVEAQVTFNDASAYFSEEEWTLLQEWQRELYRNVMKEIHQALISLGPLIATTVCSLRDKEKEEICALDTISHSTEFQYANTDMCLRKEDQSASLMGRGDGGGENSISTCSGTVVSTSEVSFCIKSEAECYGVDRLDCERREVISSPKGVISVDVSLTGRLGTTEGEENSIGPSSVVDQFHIKEEQDTCSMDHQNSERIMDINSSVGDGFTTRQCTGTDSVTCTKNSQSLISSSGEANGEMFQNSIELPDYRSQLWPQNHLKLEVKKTMPCESDFRYLTHDNVLQCLTKTGISYAYNECQSNLRNAVLSTYHQKAKQVPEPYVCTQYEKNLSQNSALTTLKKSQTEIRPQERPYACTICKKSFSVKCDLNRHWRTHTGEKPYTCPDCQKSFSQKGDLNRHQRAHAGEKPYTCAFCQKSFSRKDILNEHRRIHTGGRKMLSRKDQKS